MSEKTKIVVLSTKPILALVAEDMCPICGGELDTGFECNRCGFDALPLVKQDRQ